MKNIIQNPILPGSNPAPCVTRAGDDFYMATSTFEWFPGVQIRHSKDLVNWRLLTRPLTRRIGYGLSYTRFSQRDLRVVLKENVVNISVEVENTGEVAGDEVVQVYLSRPPLGVMTPEKELVGFARVTLAPGEQKTVDISVDLGYFAVIPGDVLGTAEPVVLPGRYTLQAGQALTLLELGN